MAESPSVFSSSTDFTSSLPLPIFNSHDHHPPPPDASSSNALNQQQSFLHFPSQHHHHHHHLLDQATADGQLFSSPEYTSLSAISSGLPPQAGTFVAVVPPTSITTPADNESIAPPPQQARLDDESHSQPPLSSSFEEVAPPAAADSSPNLHSPRAIAHSPPADQPIPSGGFGQQLSLASSTRKRSLAESTVRFGFGPSSSQHSGGGGGIGRPATGEEEEAIAPVMGMEKHPHHEPLQSLQTSSMGEETENEFTSAADEDGVERSLRDTTSSRAANDAEIDADDSQPSSDLGTFTQAEARPLFFSATPSPPPEIRERNGGGRKRFRRKRPQAGQLDE